MSHVSYELVVSHGNGSCRISMSHYSYAWVMSCMHESCLTRMSRMNESFLMWMSRVSYQWAIALMYVSSLAIWRTHISNELVTWHMNELCESCHKVHTNPYNGGVLAFTQRSNRGFAVYEANFMSRSHVNFFITPVKESCLTYGWVMALSHTGPFSRDLGWIYTRCIEKSNPHEFELHRLSIKGIKLLFLK